jgi:hypothetical protein
MSVVSMHYLAFGWTHLLEAQRVARVADRRCVTVVRRMSCEEGDNGAIERARGDGRFAAVERSRGDAMRRPPFACRTA